MWRMCNHRGWLWSQMTQLTSNAVTWAIITKRDSQRIWYVGTSISGPWRRVRVRGRLTSWSERMPLGYVSQYWYSKILHHQMCFPRFYLHQFLRVCYHETPFFSLFFLITNVRFFYIFFSVTPSTPKKKHKHTNSLKYSEFGYVGGWFTESNPWRIGAPAHSAEKTEQCYSPRHWTVLHGYPWCSGGVAWEVSEGVLNSYHTLI